MPESMQQPNGPEHSAVNSGGESWRKWKVKPDLVYIPAQVNDPKSDVRATETGIGKRIAYCRGQLDNLSVEAFVRYLKNFDGDGISRMSIIRYEAGESLPGARELRILCDALWVSPSWMLTGIVDSKSNTQSALEKALQDFVLNVMNSGLPGGFGDLVKYEEQRQVEKRQQWIDEARKPKAK
ncbi:MAG: helix-turn-helix transcriptional regulator [Gallionella sp.]|nr:helix-turn-helix transcriptional regulator [Gallionella sp.]